MLTAYVNSIYSEERACNLLLRDMYELLILKYFFASKFRMAIVLKGLAVARLAYGIGMGSDGIEFVTLDEIQIEEFLGIIENLTIRFPNITIEKRIDRRYSSVIILKILEKKSFEISLEITTIKYNWKKGINYITKLLSVRDWTLCIIGQVIPFSEIIKDYPKLNVLNYYE